MKKSITKFTILLIIYTLVVVGLVTTALAYMFTKTEKVTNELVRATVNCELSETFDSALGIKSAIRVKNTGNVPEYLRVKLVSYWVDDDGSIVGVPSEMPTVSIDSDKWAAGPENTYYYKNSVAPGAQTENLLASSITLTEKTVTIMDESVNVRQVLVVIPEAVQANPADAAEELWGVTITNGTIA